MHWVHHYSPQRHGIYSVPALALALFIAVCPNWCQADEIGAENSWGTLLEGLGYRGNSPDPSNSISGNQTLTYTSGYSGASSHTNTLGKAFFANEMFTSELEAVTHAMNNYNPLSIQEDREYIGAIYQLPEGDFIYSVAPGVIGSDTVKARIPKLQSGRIVAFWHTHGGAHWSRKFFSDIDTSLVKQWQLPFYMGSADGNLRVFRPSHQTMSYQQARRFGLGNHNGYGLGEMIDEVSIAIR